MIIKKVKLVAAPFVGTSVTIRLPADDLSIVIYQWTFTEGSASVKIDWGDGQSEEVSATTAQHTYAAPGDYVIRLSDDLSQFGMAFNTTKYFDTAKIIAAESNATKLTSLAGYAFASCSNLTKIDFSKAKLVVLNTRCFQYDAQIASPVYLPYVTTINGLMTFAGCTSIREIHFAKANEDAIKSCHYVQLHPDLGASNAVVTYDL